MRYPYVPPYAQRREFHRPFWEMLSAALADVRQRGLDLVRTADGAEDAKSCH